MCVIYNIYTKRIKEIKFVKLANIAREEDLKKSLWNKITLV